MARYITNWYQTDNAAEAERLARIDKTENIKITPNVYPVHIATSWTVWSDGQIWKRTRAFKGETVKTLPNSVASQIEVIVGADGGCIEGGLNQLAAAVNVESQQVANNGANGVYQGGTLEQLIVTFQDGRHETFFAVSKGYCEGYYYEAFKSLADARSAYNTL